MKYVRKYTNIKAIIMAYTKTHTHAKMYNVSNNSNKNIRDSSQYTIDCNSTQHKHAHDFSPVGFPVNK